MVDIIGVPVAQFVGYYQPQRISTVIKDSSQDSTDIFKPVDYVHYHQMEVTDDIIVLTNPLMESFPKTTVDSLMIHINLRYEDIQVGNKAACLNLNFLGI